MKKLLSAMVLLSVSSLFLLTSCSKSSDSSATIADATVGISVTANGAAVANNGTVFPDDSVIVTVTCTGNASNNLKHVKLMVSGQSTAALDVDITGTSVTKTYFWPAQGSTSVTFTATVTGSTGNPGTATFTIGINDLRNSNPVLGNQVNANPKFWSLSNDSTYSLSDVAARPSLASKIDFGYCSRTTGNLLISPDDSNATAIYATQWSAANEKITTWTSRNTTKFILVSNSVVSSSDFSNATTRAAQYALIVKAKAAGEPNISAVSIFDTQIYLFKTAAGKYGLLSVVSATGSVTGGTPNDGLTQLQIYYLN
jgi:hypothetical protein